MTKKLALIVVYWGLNLLGWFLCLSFEYSVWRGAKMEGRDYYEFGDNLNADIHFFPVLLVCFLVNIAWGIKAIRDALRRRDYQAAIMGGAVWGGWAIVMSVFRVFFVL